jgi:hypothetical protein
MPQQTSADEGGARCSSPARANQTAIAEFVTANTTTSAPTHCTRVTADRDILRDRTVSALRGRKAGREAHKEASDNHCTEQNRKSSHFVRLDALLLPAWRRHAPTQVVISVRTRKIAEIENMPGAERPLILSYELTPSGPVKCVRCPRSFRPNTITSPWASLNTSPSASVRKNKRGRPGSETKIVPAPAADTLTLPARAKSFSNFEKLLLFVRYSPA